MATFNEAFLASLSYFDGDEIAAQKFVSKYALHNNEGDILELTPDDLHRRLAKEFARIEASYQNPMSEDEIFGLFEGFKYVIAQGSPMSGIGNPFQLQSLSNCFVIESPYDSYAGILKTDQEQVQIMKRRGGVGFDLSTIRPKDFPTANAARTTDGISVFMERWSNSCREVAQGGRRGALMLTISCHHPQIRDFINIKRDLKKVTGANISVRLTDEFMNAVKNGTDVQLRFPVEKDVPHSFEEYVDARKIWDELIDGAHNFAEPGLLFWDTILTRSPADIYAPEGFGTVSTNPCLTGDVKVAVADGRGLVPIKQLADEGRDVPVYACDKDGKMIVRTMRNPRLTGNQKPVYKVTIEGGHSFKATPNHKMRMIDGTYREVKDLVAGDQLYVGYRRPGSLVELTNDGVKHSELKYTILENAFGKKSEHRLIWEHRNGSVPTGHVIHHADLDPRTQQHLQDAIEQGYDVRVVKNSHGMDVIDVKRRCEECGHDFWNDYYRREVSFCSISCSNNYVNRTSDINARHTVSLIPTAAQKALETKKNVLDEFTSLRFSLGRDPMQKELIQKCKEKGVSFRLKTKHGFKNWDEVQEAAVTHNHRVVSVEFIGTEDVFNGTVDEVHEFHIAVDENLLLNNKNCGEIVLSPDDSCRLMLINLVSFVDAPFTKSAMFDFKKFKDVVFKAQRLMDDLIDLEIECVDRIIKKVETDPEPESIKKTELELWHRIKDRAIMGRRTGLGITGLGDMLAMLNVRYGSDESIEIVEHVYRDLALESYRSSAVMAKERGPFSVHNYEREKDHPFIRQLFDADPELEELVRVHGRRNIACNTTAPAGTVSLMTQTTSGIEPAFLISYVRRAKVAASDKNAAVSFTDELGDRWQEFEVFHHGFKQWMDVTGKTSKDVAESPYWGATSADIDWQAKIRMQAAAQKWIDHSISNCLAGDTLIETDKGLMYLDEICIDATVPGQFVDVGNLIVKNHKMEMVQAAQAYNNAVKPTLIVTLSNGLSIQSTANERLFVDMGGQFEWVFVRDLKPGMSVKISNT